MGRLVFRWIEAMESLPSLLVPGLVHIVDSADHKGWSTLSASQLYFFASAFSADIQLPECQSSRELPAPTCHTTSNEH